MKKLLLVILLVTLSHTAFAVEIEDSGPMRKLQRGFVNVALSPMELSTELAKEKKENPETMPPSWLAGIARGSAFMVGRALVGIYEIVTFPIPLPKDYGPVLQPEFPWQHLPKS